MPMNLLYSILFYFYLATSSVAPESNLEVENDLTKEKSNVSRLKELKQKINFYKSKFMNNLKNQQEQAIYDLIECNNKIKSLTGQAKENMLKKRDEIFIFIKGINKKITDFGVRSRSRFRNLGTNQLNKLKRKPPINKPEKLKTEQERLDTTESGTFKPLPIRDKEYADLKMMSSGEKNQDEPI